MMMDNMGGMMAWMLLWGLSGLTLLILIVVAIAWLIRHMSPGSASPSASAEQELRRRYAAGELDDEEYERRRAEIRRR